MQAESKQYTHKHGGKGREEQSLDHSWRLGDKERERERETDVEKKKLSIK